MASAYSGVATAGDIVALPQALMDVYSSDIAHTAQGIMRYEEFAMMKDDLTKQPGETIVFTYYSDITRGGPLTENVAMETKSLSSSQKSITVTEYGNAVGVSEKLLQLTWDDLLAETAVLLGRDYAVVRDLAIRDACVAGGSSIVFANPNASVLGDVAQADTLDIETLRRSLELLSTANAPKFLDDFYVCFVHPHQSTYLRRDPDWISANNYANTRALFNGEIGRWEDVLFIETSHQGNGAAAATAPGYDATLDGTGSGAANLYRATLCADQSYGVADALMVEMRHDGVTDFGRKHGMAWYAIWGQDVLESDYMIHMISG